MQTVIKDLLKDKLTQRTMNKRFFFYRFLKIQIDVGNERMKRIG